MKSTFLFILLITVILTGHQHIDADQTSSEIQSLKARLFILEKLLMVTIKRLDEKEKVQAGVIFIYL